LKNRPWLTQVTTDAQRITFRTREIETEQLKHAGQMLDF